MDRTMTAIETALAVTLLPHFIADTSWVSGLMPLVAGENGQDDDGCPTDLKGAWTDVEENLNACEKGSHDQSWSASRAVMSMACRNTTAIIDSAVRMNSTLYGVLFSMLKFSLVHIPVLSSPTVQAGFIAPSATQHRQSGLSLTAILSRQSQGREKAHGATTPWASCTYTDDGCLVCSRYPTGVPSNDQFLVGRNNQNLDARGRHADVCRLTALLGAIRFGVEFYTQELHVLGDHFTNDIAVLTYPTSEYDRISSIHGRNI